MYRYVLSKSGGIIMFLSKIIAKLCPLSVVVVVVYTIGVVLLCCRHNLFTSSSFSQDLRANLNQHWHKSALDE